MSDKKTMSIMVLCFSNYHFLFDMLLSIFNQSYRPIQLIVSDDASDDFCVAEVKAFCDAYNQENGISVFINQNEKNLGTVGHLERLLPLCMGDIIWTLAADDVIHDCDVVSRFIDAFASNHDISILSSQVELYDEKLEKHKGNFLSKKDIKLLEDGSSKQQFVEFACRCVIPAVGTCYRKELAYFTDNLAEKFWLIEDWPFYVRLVRSGIAIRYVDMVSVNHRSGGVSHGNKRGYNTVASQRKYSQDLLNVYRYEIHPYISSIALTSRHYVIFRSFLRFLHHKLWTF